MKDILMYQVVERVTRSGNHCFSPDTMAFFRSRIGTWAYEGDNGIVWFVTSEKFSSGSTRLYTIRYMTSDDSEEIVRVKTYGKFQGYSTRKAATEKAKELAKKNVTPMSS